MRYSCVQRGVANKRLNDQNESVLDSTDKVRQDETKKTKDKQSLDSEGQVRKVHVSYTLQLASTLVRNDFYNPF